MINKSQIIGKLVFDMVANYNQRQNDTKLAFFKYLSNGKSTKDFEKVANKLWNNIDHEFMDKQIEKLQKIVHDENVKLAVLYDKKNKDKGLIQKDNKMYFKLVPESEFNKVEQRYKNNVIKYYANAKKTSEAVDLDTYLEKKLNVYDRDVNQIKAYYNKDNEVIRHVDISSYLSMLHNTNLTRAGWNTTINDAVRLGNETFIIPPHPFSCEECAERQGIPFSLDEVISEFGVDGESEGELIHPNCKCTLSILWDTKQLDDIRKNTLEYDEEDRQEQYEIRQKVNSYSLQRDRIENDRNIAKALGNEGLVDKYNNKISKLNNKIETMVNSLPTKSLKKQVEAINR